MVLLSEPQALQKRAIAARTTSKQQATTLSPDINRIALRYISVSTVAQGSKIVKGSFSAIKAAPEALDFPGKRCYTCLHPNTAIAVAAITTTAIITQAPRNPTREASRILCPALALVQRLINTKKEGDPMDIPDTLPKGQYIAHTPPPTSNGRTITYRSVNVDKGGDEWRTS